MAHVFRFVKGATNKGKVQISMSQCVNALNVIKDYKTQFEELFAHYYKPDQEYNYPKISFKFATDEQRRIKQYPLPKENM